MRLPTGSEYSVGCNFMGCNLIITEILAPEAFISSIFADAKGV
jgi:hypothetical protein